MDDIKKLCSEWFQSARTLDTYTFTKDVADVVGGQLPLHHAIEQQVREVSAKLATLAESQGIDSTPIHNYTACLPDRVTNEVGDTAWALVKRLESASGSDAATTQDRHLSESSSVENSTTETPIDLVNDRDKYTPLEMAFHTCMFIIESTSAWSLRVHMAETAEDRSAALEAIVREASDFHQDKIYLYRKNVSPVLDRIGIANADRYEFSFFENTYDTAHRAVGVLLSTSWDAASYCDPMQNHMSLIQASESLTRFGDVGEIQRIKARVQKEHASAVALYGHEATNGAKASLAAHGSDFPYEYDTDLHWLWGWGKVVRLAIEGIEERFGGEGPGPDDLEFLPWNYRPSTQAREAMMRFSVSYRHVIKQLEDALTFTEALFEKRSQSPDAMISFLDSLQTMQRRVFTACETIASDQETSKHKSTAPRRITDLAWEQTKTMHPSSPGFIVASFTGHTPREVKESLPSFHQPQWEGMWSGVTCLDGSQRIYTPLGTGEPPKGWINLAGLIGELLHEGHEAIGISRTTLAIDNTACRLASAVLDLADRWPQGIYGKPKIYQTQQVENPIRYAICPSIRKVAEGMLTILDNAAILAPVGSREESNTKADPKLLLKGIITDAMQNDDASLTARGLAERLGIGKTTVADSPSWKIYAKWKKQPDQSRRELHEKRAKLSDYRRETDK